MRCDLRPGVCADRMRYHDDHDENDYDYKIIHHKEKSILSRVKTVVAEPDLRRQLIEEVHGMAYLASGDVFDQLRKHYTCYKMFPSIEAVLASCDVCLVAGLRDTNQHSSQRIERLISRLLASTPT